MVRHDSCGTCQTAREFYPSALAKATLEANSFHIWPFS
jgi:hypothetical protein